MNRNDRRLLDERLQAVLARWQEEWCPAAEAVEITPWDRNFAPALDSNDWRTGIAVDDWAVSVGTAADADDALVSVLLGRSVRATGSVAADLKRAASEALVAALLHAIDPSGQHPAVRWHDTAPGVEVLEPTSGFVAVRCRLGGVTLDLVLHPALAERYLPEPVESDRERERLVPVPTALSSETVVVEVAVGEAELLLPELSTLAVGDVIRLDRRLDQPLRVELPGVGVIAVGHLGLVEDQKAVQLLPLSGNHEV